MADLILWGKVIIIFLMFPKAHLWKWQNILVTQNRQVRTVSPAGSVGAFELRSKVATGNPHP
ncbi:MAG: hypothetical protein ACI4QR_00980 [Eubacteriales bacterium]